jgi:hypothetical protein
MPEPQSFKNHGRLVPIWHIGVFFSLVANFFWAVYRLWHGVSGDTVIQLILAVALILLFGSVRVQILTVQDRVIRLEMRLRLAHVLPPEMHEHIPALSVSQLVALRFAADAELAALVQDVIAGTCTTQKEIKMRVKDWQGDFQRA